MQHQGRVSTVAVVVTVLIGMVMLMSSLSWIAGQPCLIMHYQHAWFTALPIDAAGFLILWRIWRRKKFA